MIVDTKYQFGRGLPIEAMARNGQITDGANMATLANYVNMIAARRFKILAQGGNSISGLLSTSATIAAQWHTSPNCGGVEVVLVLGPSTSATAFGSYTFTVDGVAQATRYITGDTGGVSGPNDLVFDHQTFVDGSGDPLAGDTDYEATMTLTNAALLYYIIYERPRNSLDTDTDTAIATDVFAYNAPILDRDVATMVDAMWKLHRRQGAVHFTHQVQLGTPPSEPTTTFINILDGSLAIVGAAAAGFWTIPYRKNRLAGSTVDVVLWAYGEVVAPGAGTGQVKFANSAGTIGTVTGFAGAAEFRSTTGTLDATISTSDLVVVSHRITVADGAEMVTYAAGMYEYLT